MATNATRPSLGSSKASPASGVPTRIVRTAQALTSAIAAAGASGRVRCAAAKITAKGTPAVSPSTSAPSAESASGPPSARRSAPTRRSDERDADEHAATHATGEHASQRAGEDADEEDEPAGEPRRCGRHALALEQRYDPVSRDHCESERRRLQDADRQEFAIAEQPVAGMADARKAGGHERRDGSEDREQRGAPVGRTPARRVGESRHHHQREPAARHRRAAVEALQCRPTAAGPYEVETCDECRARPDSDDGTAQQRELDAFVEEQDPVAHDRGSDRRESDALRPVSIRATPGRKLYGQVRHEERGRQETDRRERHAVMVGERIGDRADVGDVPGQAAADRESCDDAAT